MLRKFKPTTPGQAIIKWLLHSFTFTNQVLKEFISKTKKSGGSRNDTGKRYLKILRTSLDFKEIKFSIPAVVYRIWIK